jgi:hypothetical protein
LGSDNTTLLFSSNSSKNTKEIKSQNGLRRQRLNAENNSILTLTRGTEEPMINSFLSLSLQERYVINYRVTKDSKIWRRQEVYQDLWSEVVRRRRGAWHMNVLKRERAYLLFLLTGSKQRTCVSVWLRWSEGKGRHKPDSDGLSSVPIIVFLVYAEEFSKIQSAWWIHENSVLLSVLKLYEYNICRHVDLGLRSSHFHPSDIWAIMGYRFIFYFCNQRISHFFFSAFFQAFF